MTTVTNKNGIEFDIDALATDVNGKADKDLINVSSNVSVCIESWHEGTEWYRIYSDGWCEQGGYVSSSEGTITFLKQFANTDYYANIIAIVNSSSGSNVYASKIKSKLVGSMNYYINANNGTWEAKGYIR